MSAYFLPNIKTTYFDQNGDPLSGGSVFTYVAGTTVPAATFTTTAGLIQNTNPVILDASGSADIYLSANINYKFVVYDRDGVLIDRVEPVFGSAEASIKSVTQFGAVGNGIADDTGAFISAGYNAYVPEGTYLVNPATVSIKSYWGPGKLRYTTDGSEHWVGLASRGTLFIRNDDVNGDLTPKVPADGLINLADGELKFMCDMDGDGDYDADILGKNNLYVAGMSSIHLRTAPGLSSEGRFKFVSTNSTNYIQSGKNYSGTTHQHLAFSEYNSTNAWIFINRDTTHVAIGNTSTPDAPLHVINAATTAGLFENTSTAISRIGFKGNTTSSGTSVTIGADADDMVIRTGGVDAVRVLSTGTVRPVTDMVSNLGTSSIRWNAGFISTLFPGAGSVQWTSGAGSPEGVLSAARGSLYTRTDGGAGTTLYVKETGSGNTGWVPK